MFDRVAIFYVWCDLSYTSIEQASNVADRVIVAGCGLSWMPEIFARFPVTIRPKMCLPAATPEYPSSRERNTLVPG